MDHTPHTTDPGITATLVPDHERLGFLPSLFGRYLFRGESSVYAWMSHLSRDYTGGYWQFMRLSNGSGYLVPTCAARLRLVCDNGYEGEVSADAAGLVATLYAVNHLANHTGDAPLIDRYHALREYALDVHPEAAAIARAID